MAPASRFAAAVASAVCSWRERVLLESKQPESKKMPADTTKPAFMVSIMAFLQNELATQRITQQQ
jgi:hypothetical protein